MKNIAIIGGGAAGFFAAITAKKQNKNNEVLIFERSKRVLAKVAITGGGRCNVTNSFNEISSLTTAYPRGHKLLKRLFNIFDYTSCYQWFEEHGVKLITQEDNCVFPQSQDAQSIVQCLVNEAHKLGVKVITDHWLENIEAQENGTICLHFKDKGKRCFDAVAITTGGSPRIEPLQYLAKCGHKIEQPVPSLFTFNINNNSLKSLMERLYPMPAYIFQAQRSIVAVHFSSLTGVLAVLPPLNYLRMQPELLKNRIIKYLLQLTGQMALVLQKLRNY